MRGRILSFKRRDIEEALLAHADSLVGKADNGDRLLRRYAQVGQALEGLFGLAQRVRGVLIPVDPTDAFVAELKARLAEVRGDQLERTNRRREIRRMMWQMAGVAGLMLSGAAMLALGMRFLINMLSRYRATTAI